MSTEGVVTAFGLAPAECDERKVGEFLVASGGHDAFLADKGFLRRLGEALDGSARRAGRSNPTEEHPAGLVGAVCRWSASKWQIVEGIIWRLKDLSSVERHRTKTLGGLLTRLAAKVAVYTCGQLLNVRLGRPLRPLAELFI